MKPIWTAEVIGPDRRESHSHRDYGIAREWLDEQICETWDNAEANRVLDDLREWEPETDFVREIGGFVVRICMDYEESWVSPEEYDNRLEHGVFPEYGTWERDTWR